MADGKEYETDPSSATFDWHNFGRIGSEKKKIRYNHKKQENPTSTS